MEARHRPSVLIEFRTPFFSLKRICLSRTVPCCFTGDNRVNLFSPLRMSVQVFADLDGHNPPQVEQHSDSYEPAAPRGIRGTAHSTRSIARAHFAGAPAAARLDRLAPGRGTSTRKCRGCSRRPWTSPCCGARRYSHACRSPTTAGYTR